MLLSNADIDGSELATEAHIIRRKMKRFADVEASEKESKAKKLRNRVDQFECKINSLAKSMKLLHRKEGKTAQSAGDIVQRGKEIVQSCRQFVENCQQQPIVEPSLVTRLESLEADADQLTAAHVA